AEPMRATYAERYGRPVEADFVATSSAAALPPAGSPLDQELELGLEWVTLEAGELLVREGEPSDAAYGVGSGRLQAMIERPGAAHGALAGGGFRDARPGPDRLLPPSGRCARRGRRDGPPVERPRRRAARRGRQPGDAPRRRVRAAGLVACRGGAGQAVRAVPG